MSALQTQSRRRLAESPVHSGPLCVFYTWAPPPIDARLRLDLRREETLAARLARERKAESGLQAAALLCCVVFYVVVAAIVTAARI